MHRPASQNGIAYLSSRYPAVSHTFILREVLALREHGLTIGCASINSPDRPLGGMTDSERAESETTYYVKRSGVAGALAAKLKTLVTNPGGYFAGLGLALRLGGLDLKRFAYAMFYFAEAMMIGQWMRREGLSHLHVHFANPASTVGLLVKRIFGVSLSISAHGPDIFYDIPGTYLERKVAESDFMLCISHYARSQLMRLSDHSEWDKLELAPLGVDPGIFAQVEPPRNETFHVLCVGRLVPAKGQHVLVDALQKLLDGGRNCRLTFVGDGPDRGALETHVRTQGLEDHVTFTGSVNQDRIRELYASADAFCLASFAEGKPVVLMEAMAMGVPCITTRITGVPELIRDGVDGLLVAASDVGGLADAVARLMDETGLAERLIASARQRVTELYDLNRNTARIAEIFRQRLALDDETAESAATPQARQA